MKRDFTYIDDIVTGVLKVLDNPPEGSPEWSGKNPDPSSSPAPYRIYNIGNSNPTLTNCVIWGNKAQDGPQIYLDSDSHASVNYSDVLGGEQDVYMGQGCTLIWGEGNIETDPYTNIIRLFYQLSTVKL